MKNIIQITNMFRRTVSIRADASFTIEAAVILPLTFLMIVWMINASLNIHGQVRSFSQAICDIIEKAPKEEADVPDEYSDIIDTSTLNGRKMLLKYKLLKDGIKIITGGLTDD